MILLDESKRPGLDLDGIAIDHSSGLLYDATMAVAEGRLDKADLATLPRRLTSGDGSPFGIDVEV